jgi:hypothetical protein
MALRGRRILSGLLVLAILGLAVASNLSTLHKLRSQWQKNGIGNDGPSIWNERVAPLNDDLPFNAVVGYLSERDIPGVSYDPIDQDEEFVMTQYFLAPRIIVEGAGQSYVIGNFGTPQVVIADVERRFDLQLVKDYSMGIFLFKKSTP